jgi:hypothetical protein
VSVVLLLAELVSVLHLTSLDNRVTSCRKQQYDEQRALNQKSVGVRCCGVSVCTY